MAELIQTAQWNHTSAIVAMIHNVNCTKQSHMKSPADFHPLLSKKRSHRVSITKDTIWLLKALVPANKRR